MNTTDTTIQFRVDSKTKREARRVFDEFGLDMTTAIKLFLRKSITSRSIPFSIQTENGYTEKFEDSILNEKIKVDDGEFNEYKNTKEMVHDIMNK